MKPAFRLQLLAVAKHYAEAGVHEEGGNNRGQLVEHFQRVNDGNPGDAWCADFVTTCGVEAKLAYDKVENADKSDYNSARTWLAQNYFAPSAGVEVIYNDAKKRGILKPKTWQATPGCLVIYKFTTGWHIGVVDVLEGKTLYAIEGNTGGGSDRDGDGVYRKKRDLTYVAGFVDLGNQ
jgi:hypothetical protein